MAQYLDLHIHSMNSIDSNTRTTRIFDKALDVGLRGVAITDHNVLTMVNSPLSEVIAIPGMEIFIEEVKGDLIALGIKKKIRGDIGLKKAIESIHSQGGVAIVPHPFSSSSNYPAVGEALFEVGNMIDGIDITSPKHHVDNRRARKVAEQLRVAKIGSSDAHREEDIGRAVTVFHRPVFSERDVLDQIRSRQVKAKLMR